MKLSILNYIDGTTLFTGDFNNVKDMLETAVYEGVSLAYADLSGVDLSGIDLYNPRKTWKGARLVGALLCGSDLSDSNLSCADLTRANAAGVNFSGCTLKGAYLTEANFFRADLSRTILTPMACRHANFTKAKLHNSRVVILEKSQRSLTEAANSHITFRKAA